MQITETCWEGCGAEGTFDVPVSRGSDELTEGVPVACPECGHKYTLTVDGDGEVDLESLDDDSLGQGASDPDITHY